MFISDIFIYQQLCILWLVMGRRSPDRMVDGFITTYTMSIYHYSVVSSNPAQARCTRYNIVWSSLSATWGQVGSFPRILRLPPPIKLTATIFLKVLKVAPLKLEKNMIFFAENRDFSHEIPQQFSRLPPFGAIFLSAPPPLTWNPGSAPGHFGRCTTIYDYRYNLICMTMYQTLIICYVIFLKAAGWYMD